MFTKRTTTPALEDILEKEYKVLDHGFIRLVDYMGNDASIVQAARVSYGEGTKTVSEDSGLISYLIRNKHTTPLEMCELKFHCKMPIFVARQWIRHRTASVNEMSARYSVIKDEFYIPPVWRGQAKANKQGSEGEIDYAPSIWELAEYAYADSKSMGDFDELDGDHASVERAAFFEYQSRVKGGIGREIARCCLPVSTYTEWYWKIDLHNLLNFLRLRNHSHAQEEIRVYAKIMDNIVKLGFPLTHEHFQNHVVDAVTFSGDEYQLLREYMITKEMVGEIKVDLPLYWEEKLGKTRAKEFMAKVNMGW